MLYIISTELEPNDVIFFNDFYDTVAINKNAVSDNALKLMQNNLKSGLRPYILFATRQFEKVYRIATVYKISKMKDQLFDNQFEILCDDPDTLIYTRSNRMTYLFHQPELWQCDMAWSHEYLTPFNESHKLYCVNLLTNFAKFILNYISASSSFDWNVIKSDCTLFKFNYATMQKEPMTKLKTYIATCNVIESLSTTNIYGVHTIELLTPGSWILLSHNVDNIKYIYGVIRVAYSTPVKRLNVNRFIGHITPLMPIWNNEVICDFACPARHIYYPEKWGCTIDESIMKNIHETLQSLTKCTVVEIQSSYINEYVSALSSNKIPKIELPTHNNALSSTFDDDNLSYGNYYQNQIKDVQSIKRVYMLSTSCTRNNYTKLTINGEECVYIDMSPSLYFKVNVSKWDKRIVKQFLEDIKNNQAYLFITNKNHKAFLLSLQVTGLIKHKSKKDLIYSIAYSSWILDKNYDSDLYCMSGVVPILIKAKHLWKDVDSSGIKQYNQICQVLKDCSKTSLVQFSVDDTGERLDMFDYLKTYLIYQTKARDNNQLVNINAEDVYTYCDAIAEEDLHLPLRLYWNTTQVGNDML